MHPVWDSFTRKRGKSVATCNYCQSDVSAKSDRLKTHLKKCRRIKNNSTTSADMATPSPPSNNTADIQEIAIDESPAPATSTPPKPKKPKVHQPSIIFGVKTDSKTRALLDDKLLIFFMHATFFSTLPAMTNSSKWLRCCARDTALQTVQLWPMNSWTRPTKTSQWQ